MEAFPAGQHNSLRPFLFIHAYCNSFLSASRSLVEAVNFIYILKHKDNCYIAGVFPATVRPFIIGLFIVTWRLTMKLFPAKCHERATLRKL